MGRIYTAIDPKTGRPAQFYGEHVSKQVSTTRAWVAGTVLADLDLPKDLLITNVRVNAAMTATLTATAQVDAPKRALNTLEIVGDSKNFLSLSGGTQLGRLLALLNQCDTQAATLNQNTDVGATAFQQSYVFHPGHFPRDRFDMSCYIPARALSQLVARIGSPVAAAPDAAGNFTAGTYSIEVDGVQGVPISPGSFYPAPLVQAYPHTAITAALAQKFDAPTGGYLRRIVIMTDDNTAVPLRSDAQVTAFQVELPKDSKNLITHSINALKFVTAQRYGVVGDAQPLALGALATTRPGYNGAMHMPIGFGIIDLRDYFDPVLGMNLRAAQQGDAKLAMTIAVATGTTYIYWDIWYPMDPSWIGK